MTSVARLLLLEDEWDLVIAERHRLATRYAEIREERLALRCRLTAEEAVAYAAAMTRRTSVAP